MGATTPSYAELLSPVWQKLAKDLLSPDYRQVMSRFTGVELAALPMEANLFHYGQSAWLGPHVDLEDKVVTHVLYFNEAWTRATAGA